VIQRQGKVGEQRRQVGRDAHRDNATAPPLGLIAFFCNLA
jgi:hypothetical protein